MVLAEVDSDGAVALEQVLSPSHTVGSRHRVSDPGLAVPKVAVPTVLIWLGALLVWVAATTVVLSDLSRWWLVVTIPVHACITYSMFTVLHDSIHHAVGRWTWVNELFGRLSMPFVGLWTTYPVMRYIHIEHHRNTNEDPHSDPDAWVHAGPYWQHPFRWMTIDAWYARFCLPRIRHRPRTEIIGLLINQTLVVALLSALVGFGYGWELLLIYLIPQRLGLGILAWWFDWLPHHDLGVTAKADPIRASRVRVGWESLMNPLMFCQNYHVVHHLHPRIPFYLWAKAWKKTEADYLDRAVPITTAWGRELTPSEYRAWREKTGRGRRANQPGGCAAIGQWNLCGLDDLATTAMQTLTDHHVPNGQPAHELWASTSRTEFADDAAAMRSTVVVTLGVATEQTTTVGDESLLETALRAGIDAPYSCIGGGCADCKAKLLLGNVHMEQNYGLGADDVAEGWILTCQSRPTTDVVHIEYQS